MLRKDARQANILSGIDDTSSLNDQTMEYRT